MAIAPAMANTTLYGTMDASLRVRSNTNLQDASKYELTPGTYYASNFGIRGREDIGNGNYVSFQLEQGFNPLNGTSADPTRAFNRHAWVGAGGAWGSVSMGRQYTPLHDLLGPQMWDVLGVGGYEETGWFAGLQYSPREDNSIKYKGKFLGVEAGLIYALSEGNNRNSFGASVTAPLGALTAALAHHTRYGATGALKTNMVGFKYALQGGVQLQGNALYSKDSRAAPREDRTLSLGVVVPVTKELLVSGGLYRSKVDAAADTGTRTLAVVRAQYALSKRTEIYVEVDRTFLKRGQVQEFNSAGKIGHNSTRSGASIGMMTWF